MAGMHVSVVGQPQTARETRRPTHTFNLRHIPYQIQPFFIAPVLPGETMKNLVMQARVVTDPVVNPLIGWWLEYYIFYVKHRDLNIRDQLTDMVLNPSFDPTTPVDITEAADLKYFHVSAGINWARQCLERVVEEFFRNEGRHGMTSRWTECRRVRSIQIRGWTVLLITRTYRERLTQISLSMSRSLQARHSKSPPPRFLRKL